MLVSSPPCAGSTKQSQHHGEKHSLRIFLVFIQSTLDYCCLLQPLKKGSHFPPALVFAADYNFIPFL